MLLELRVENLLLIERAELRPAGGLNVLTGETGAGKTVLAHALDLLLGGRARPGVVRPGGGGAARGGGAGGGGGGRPPSGGSPRCPRRGPVSAGSGCRPTPRRSCW